MVHTLLTKNDTVFAGTYGGGVFRSGNNGTTWSAVNTGLSAALVTSFVKSSNTLVTGTNGVGAFNKVDGSSTWTAINTGLTYQNIRCLAIRCDTLLYAGTGYGVFCTSRLLMSWRLVNTGITVNNDIYALTVNGSNGPDIFAGITTGFSSGGYIYHSSNDGKNWAVSANLANHLYALAANNGVLFAGIDTGVFISTDTGKTWYTANTGLTNKYVLCFAFKGNSVFAGTYGGVFKSIDTGKTWAAFSSGLTATAIYSLAAIGDSVYAGTNSGVFFYANNGTTWSQLSTGLSGIQVNALAVADTALYAGTNGSSVWRMSFSSGTTAVRPLVNKLTGISAFNVRNGSIRYTLPKVEHVSLQVYSVKGQLLSQFVNRQQAAGSYALSLQKGLFAAGSYLVVFCAGEYHQQKMVFLTK
jgi:photosystem II stability/assembly factor-like uncharacterized protein